MRKTMMVGFAMLSGVAFAKGKPKAPAAAKPAIEVPIEAKSNSGLTGKVTFTQGGKDGKDVTVKVDVEKAPPGEHAVHIHEKGDCSAPDAKSAGGHWNPANEQHGQWAHEHHHLGDIGNLKVGPDGKGEVTLTTDKWTVGGGAPNDVVGKSIVVHEKVDDFVTQPTGNAGGRIGCAVLTTVEGAHASAAPASATPAGDKKPAATPAK